MPAAAALSSRLSICPQGRLTLTYEAGYRRPVRGVLTVLGRLLFTPGIAR